MMALDISGRDNVVKHVNLVERLGVDNGLRSAFKSLNKLCFTSLLDAEKSRAEVVCAEGIEGREDLVCIVRLAPGLCVSPLVLSQGENMKKWMLLCYLFPVSWIRVLNFPRNSM
jgi:hypothetical protein